MALSFKNPGRPWLIATGIISGYTLALMYIMVQFRNPPLTGRSTPGLALGIIAAALILIVTFYSARKARPAWNFGSLETWLQMHIYLGALSLVFAFAHTGWQFNARLAVVALVLLALVVVSGAVGYLIYLKVPARMAEAEKDIVLPEEVAERLEELRNEIYLFCSESGESFAPIYEKIVVPLFDRGPGRKIEVPPLESVTGGVEDHNKEAFNVLRKSIEECVRLFSELELHFRYTRSFNLWLLFHIPLSIGMIVFLIAHIVTMLRY